MENKKEQIKISAEQQHQAQQVQTMYIRDTYLGLKVISEANGMTLLQDKEGRTFIVLNDGNLLEVFYSYPTTSQALDIMEEFELNKKKLIADLEKKRNEALDKLD